MKTLTTHDAFTSAGLPRLWAVLEEFADQGWDYTVELSSRSTLLDIQLSVAPRRSPRWRRRRDWGLEPEISVLDRLLLTERGEPWTMT